MDCADYRINCIGDSDGDGNRILHRVLNKEEAFWKVIFQDALSLNLILIYSYVNSMMALTSLPIDRETMMPPAIW